MNSENPIPPKIRYTLDGIEQEPVTFQEMGEFLHLDVEDGKRGIIPPDRRFYTWEFCEWVSNQVDQGNSSPLP